MLTRVYRLAVGNTIFRAQVHEYEDRVVIPIAGNIGEHGWVRAQIEVDLESFERARSLAREHGIDHIQVGALITRALGTPALLSVQQRPLLKR